MNAYDQTTLTAEIAYVTIGSIEETNAPGAASTTVFPKSKELFFGTNYGLAASGTVSLGLSLTGTIEPPLTGI